MNVVVFTNIRALAVEMRYTDRCETYHESELHHRLEGHSRLVLAENKRNIVCYVLLSIYRALIFICHGVGEHCSRYERLGKALAERGYVAFTHDHGKKYIFSSGVKLYAR